MHLKTSDFETNHFCGVPIFYWLINLSINVSHDRAHEPCRRHGRKRVTSSSRDHNSDAGSPRRQRLRRPYSIELSARATKCVCMEVNERSMFEHRDGATVPGARCPRWGR